MPALKSKRSHPVARDPLAIVDLGSNSARVVVYKPGVAGQLEILADARSPLRLARDLAGTSRLSDDAISRTVAAMRDFRSVAEGSSAKKVIAVATAAVRETENADELIERVRSESDVEIRVIDGEEEARYAFLGAVHGLQVERGVVIDIGGGSMELSTFRDRRLRSSFTLPVGALRLSDRFLRSDPPEPLEVEFLGEEVNRALGLIDAGSLRDGDALVGTGGTIRNLAKIDRHARAYPITRLHGYVLTLRRTQELLALLASRRSSRRRAILGLNADRVDSIVGGALVATRTMRFLSAGELLVSGQGVREGVAIDELGLGVPAVDEVRRSSLEALAERFGTWDSGRAHRRARIAEVLVDALDPDANEGERGRLLEAAFILDIGRSVDFYRRFEHSADIVTSSDLAGFSHRDLARLAAIVRNAGDDGLSLHSFRPLLGPDDRPIVERAATILATADEIEHRVLPDRPLSVQCRVRGRTVEIIAPLFDPYLEARLARRIRRAFRRRLVLREPAAQARPRRRR